jgi:DNA-directed RNA polymerase subunit RPC12/RpoP
MSFRCPGLSGRTLTSKTVLCPACGTPVEIFSDEASVRCPSCRAKVMQDPAATCRAWCNGCCDVSSQQGESSEQTVS